MFSHPESVVAGIIPATTLSVVFVASAVMSISDAISRKSYQSKKWTDMGVPAWLATPSCQAAHSIVQAILAVLLISAEGAFLWVVSSAVIVLLVSYTLILVGAYYRHVPCACFGNSASRVSWRHFVRNGILLAIASISFAGSARGYSWIQSFRDAPLGTVAISILIIAVLVLGLVLAERPANSSGQRGSAQPESNKTATETVKGASEGNGTLRNDQYKLPRVMIPTEEGWVPLFALSSGKDLLLFSLSDECHFCADVEARLPSYIETLNPHISIILLIAGNQGESIEYPGAQTYYDHSRSLWYTLEMPTPSALLIRSDGIPVGSPRSGIDAIEELVNSIYLETSQKLK